MNRLGMKVESPWDEGFKDFWSLERVGSLNSLRVSYVGQVGLDVRVTLDMAVQHLFIYI